MERENTIRTRPHRSGALRARPNPTGTADTGEDTPGCLIYSRTSDPKQAQDELSHCAQEEITVKFVEAKGYRVLPNGIYRDEGKSGIGLKLHRREQFHAMIERALSDISVAAIALYDTSRFARDRVTAATLKAKLRRAGVEILYATQTISDDPDSAVIEAIFEALEEGQSRKTGRLAGGRGLTTLEAGGGPAGGGDHQEDLRGVPPGLWRQGRGRVPPPERDPHPCRQALQEGHGGGHPPQPHVLRRQRVQHRRQGDELPGREAHG
ncbi:MAG: recombinase family protein [Candidatus Riflebacteria bacterium]|nr:recombinase family protein [Candidatus Riflebacteria bacterium]